MMTWRKVLWARRLQRTQVVPAEEHYLPLIAYSVSVPLCPAGRCPELGTAGLMARLFMSSGTCGSFHKYAMLVASI